MYIPHHSILCHHTPLPCLIALPCQSAYVSIFIALALALRLPVSSSGSVGYMTTPNAESFPTTLRKALADTMVLNQVLQVEEQQFADMDRNANDKSKEVEESLEIHEVVEINKFTEKKEWIESKITVGSLYRSHEAFLL